MVAADVEARYRARTAALEDEERATAATSRRLALARGLVFVAGLAAFLRAAWPGADPSAPAAAAAVLAALGFIALVHRHELVERRRARLVLRLAFNREGIARLARRWSDLPDHSPAPAPDHPYAADLNVTGPASLLHLIGAWCTPLGRERLVAWLLSPAPPQVVGARQQAVAELAPLDELRETLGACARPLGQATPRRFDGFLGWATDPGWFLAGGWRPWLARLVTALIWGGIVLHATGIVSWALWLPPLAGGWVLTAAWRGRTHAAFASADPGRRLFAGFPALLSAALAIPEAGVLGPARERLRAGPEPAPEALRRLERLLAAADARHMWLHFVLQSLVLWDFHVLAALERWRRRSGSHAPEWLDALAEVEAVAALSLLRFEQPEWSFPEIDAAAEAAVVASALAHPLIPAGRAVANDVRIGPPGSVLVITGSNMSGKSTLLRAAGLNVVLAQAGSVVAARAMRLPPTRVATCMRVEDSVAGGVSYFMAELLRLKRVTELVEAAAAERGLALYLLDEILQGTNTAERRVAAVHVIGRLIRSGGVGAVTTHDLALADAPELMDAAVEVHFEEQLEGDRMSFDYRLRPGRATSVNALRLMRTVGL